MKWKPALILFIFLFSAIPLKPVEAQSNYWVEIQLQEIYGIRGETIGITVLTNASTINVKICDPSDVLIYNQVWDANETRNIPIGSSSDYGTYIITGEVGETKTTTFFTVLDILGWQPIEDWPHIVFHNSLEYRFNSDWTVNVKLEDDYMNVDFKTLRELAQTYGLDVNPYYNDMNFLVRFTKGTDIKIDWNFAFIHSGAKIIINGTIDQPRDIALGFTAKQFKKWIEGLRSEHIVFDWSDMVKHSQSFTFNPETNELIAHCPKTFRIDPTIFEDGFENDYNSWSGTIGSPTIDTVTIHHGTNSSKIDVASFDEGECSYKSFGDYDLTYTRFYIYLDNYSSSTGVLPLLRGRTANYSNNNFLLSLYGASRVLRAYCYYDSDWHVLTSSTSLSLDQWNCIEVKWYKHSTAGEMRTYLNDAEVNDISFTNVNTNYQHGSIYAGAYQGSGVGTATYYLDCVVVADSYIGPEEEGQTYERNPTQNISWSSSIGRTWSLSRIMTQSLTFTWNAIGIHSAFEEFVRTLTLAVNWASSIKRRVDFHRAFSQSLTFTWNALGSKWGEWIRNLSLSINWTSSLGRRVDFHKSLSQSISFTLTLPGLIAQTLRVLVTNLNNLAIQNALVTLSNPSEGTIEWSSYTNITGYTPEYEMDQGNYTIMVSREDYQVHNSLFEFNASAIREVQLVTIDEAVGWNILSMIGLLFTGLVIMTLAKKR